MPETEDDPIRRADALPPPTLAEVAVFHWIGIQARRDPSLLDEYLERATDAALHASIRRLHGQEESPEWRQAFIDAEIRISSAVEMIRRELEALPTKKKKKHRKR